MTWKTQKHTPGRYAAALGLVLCVCLMAASVALAQGADSHTPSALPTADGTLIKPAKMRYKINMNMMGQQMEMEGVRSISEASYMGRPVWRLTDGGDSPMGAYADTVEVDRTTLLPVRRNSVGSAKTTLLYTAEAVTGSVAMGPQEMPVNVPLDAPTFGAEAGLDLALAGLPLAEGYTTALRTFHIYTQSVRAMNLAVTGTKSVEVPAGIYETLVVELMPAVPDPGERTVLHVMTDAPHHLVQADYHLPESIGGGLITVTLVDADAGSE